MYIFGRPVSCYARVDFFPFSRGKGLILNSSKVRLIKGPPPHGCFFGNFLQECFFEEYPWHNSFKFSISYENQITLENPMKKVLVYR